MVLQDQNIPDLSEMNDIKNQKIREQSNKLLDKAKVIVEKQSPQTVRAVQEAKMPGASSWLSALPLAEYGFSLNKSEFRDSIRLRYNKPLKGLPSKCSCGQKYDTNHALYSCGCYMCIYV